jgi:hypothetical protein
MDIYLLRGTFVKNFRLFSEQHFSRRQRAFCHRREGTFVFSENLGGGLGPLVPTPLNSSDKGTCTPNIRNSSARSHACIKSRN